MKIPDAKAAADKEWEKLENIPAWQLTKGCCKERRQNSALRVIDGHLSSQEFGVGTKISQNTKVELYCEVIV